MRRAAILAFLVFGLSACGLFSPEPDRDPPVPMGPAIPVAPVPGNLDEPPATFINDVAGRPVSWCWGNGCADGIVTSPLGLPAVTPPFKVTLPPDSHIEGVEAVGPAAPGDESVAVPFDGTEIGEIPPGAVMLNVFVRFEPGGDASYYWAVNRGDD
jgi:hypothetical protein